MDPIQTFRNAAGKGKVVELLAGVKKPLPTTFRRDYNINVSRELEGPIKKWAVKKARWINKYGTPQKHVQS